jgi:hypothetical protein
LSSSNKISRGALADHVLSSSVEHLHCIVDALTQRSLTNNEPTQTIPSNKQTQLIEQLQREQHILQNKLNKREQDLIRTRVDLQLYKSELCQLRKDLHVAQSSINHDGTYVWRITNVQQLLHNAKNSSQPVHILSAPFYTSTCGYKLALKLYINGDKTERDTHLSLYVTIMRGDYDCLLQWPFVYPITLCLYDRSLHRDHVVHTLTPDPSSECFEQPRMDANKSGGIPTFCPLCKVFDRNFGYVNDNTMFIKAFVDFNLYSTNVWPIWTKLQSAGLPTHAEQMTLNSYRTNHK